VTVNSGDYQIELNFHQMKILVYIKFYVKRGVLYAEKGDKDSSIADYN